MELLAENREEVSAHLRILGWISANESVASLASAGAGNMNRTLRAQVGERSFILKQSVPFVAKYPQIPAPQGRIEVEARFYTAIAETAAIASRMPSVLGYDAASHLLCLEDLGTGLDFTDLYQSQDIDQTDALATLVHWLSNLHALSIVAGNLRDGLENLAMRELNHAHIFEIPLDSNNGLTLSPGLAEIAARFAGDDQLKEKARELGDLYLGRSTRDDPAVLLHGDFYPGSWLRHATDGVRIIDPEFGFVGPPEFDVGVLLAHLLLCGYSSAASAALLGGYQQPSGFDNALANAFAGMEIIRRLLGVAQLPLTADDPARAGWLTRARSMMLP
ncbi:MAG: phosphotransferase [Gammaproteobacteria bacterium]|nr:phosphotransferase [Gammaproteobacteria bacterium]